MNRPNRSARWRAALLALVLALPNIAATEPPARITVGKAHLHGLALAGGVSAFLGIPYANAPTGARRWHVSTQARLSGEVDATHYGAACPQTEATAGWYRRLAVAMGSDGDVVPPGPTQSENCLFLNVWTPGAKVPAGKRLPVMVWVHGGSNTSGYSQEADYRGARLAARGVVVVTINYRLGALGFFAHPAVSDVSAGRQGLSDQITALRWVRDNIAAFGGDAARVTLFGESAGGTDIAALMHMPVAKGLFARAVIESGYLRADGMATPAAAAKAAADLFAHDETAATLAQRSAADLVHMQTERGKGRFVSPLVPPKPAFRVPLLIGTNADEFRLYLPSDPATRGAGEASTLLAMPNAGDVAHLLQHLSNDPATRADLLASGAYDRHLRRVRKIYLERRDVLIASLCNQFGAPRLVGHEVGSQLTWVLPPESPPARQVCESARNLGVNVEPVFGETSNSDGASAFQDRALILGYAALSTETIARGVERLGDSLKF